MKRRALTENRIRKIVAETVSDFIKRGCLKNHKPNKPFPYDDDYDGDEDDDDKLDYPYLK